MLIYDKDLLNRPVLSLQLGRELAYTTSAIIDPNQLQIIAFEVTGPSIGGDIGNILDVRSIREFSELGFIIDSSDELVQPTDVIRISQAIELHFHLVGLKVVTKKGAKLGKISSYTVNSDNLLVQQLVIKRPAIKSLLDPELIIGRSQIIEVNDFEVIVKDEAKTAGNTAEDFLPNFVNPFRDHKTEPQLAQSPSQTPGAPNTE